MIKKTGQDENERLRRLIELDKATLPPDGGERFNRLIFSSSPYLLQHAENPVDWYQWGDEAFERARAEDKPIFLSIGYATCHWCHVMEHESFEEPEVGKVMNRLFVSIKVDREERPDIDEQYMTVARIMTGGGGWPLNILMTPDRQPFYCATYLPRTPRMGMPGITDILERLGEFWRDKREAVLQNCAAVLDALGKMNAPTAGEVADIGLMQDARRQLGEMYDPVWGGFGEAPKFPMPHYLMFLLREAAWSDDKGAVSMVGKTLDMIRAGGIFDQLGGGIHRYSVDRQWLVPHFEKMLYDQALLAIAALEAMQATGEGRFEELAREICDFVLRELTAPEGGFYSALDADTEGEEGLFYTWTPAEVVEVLGKAEGELFCRLFDVTEGGNFEGRSMLHLPVQLEDFCTREGISPELLRSDLSRWRDRLFATRDRRIRPLRDEKIVTSWNGLMIAAVAKGYAVLGDGRYREAAEKALRFVAGRLTAEAGGLLRSFHHGKTSVPAFLEDYAFLVWGTVELHQATLEEGYLVKSIRLARKMLDLFRSDGGGFYERKEGGDLPVRQMGAYDSVIPSGNSVAATVLVRLGRIAGDETLLESGEKVLAAFMGSAGRQPAAYLHLISALGLLRHDPVEVAISGNPASEEAQRLIAACHRVFIPALVLRRAGEGEQMPGDRPAAFVCAAGSCRPPVSGPGELVRLLEEVARKS
ncbi:MAG: thioredoxin domain-containing protein [Geobacter sp.]|nr:thioredoxin domain-containing protein [Geobacter sp.]